jgi:hypothetical protein
VHTFRKVLLQKSPSQETLPLVILWEKYVLHPSPNICHHFVLNDNKHLGIEGVQQSRQEGVALLCVYVQEEAASPGLPIADQGTDTNNSLYMNPNPLCNLQQSQTNVQGMSKWPHSKNDAKLYLRNCP